MVDYKKGLHKIGDCTYAYLQPDGSWGWSNAGFVSDGSNSILVDTLFDLKLTREMLDEISQKVKGAEKIDTLVITHANGDHVYGNELVKGAEIIASKACAEEMTETPPQMLAEMMKAAPTLGDIGRYFTHCFSEFNFDGITLTFPTNTFEGRMDLTVGSKEVNLIEVGPCHTKGDVIVFVPYDRTVFAGDMLFIGGTPIMWIGPVKNWIQACDLMLDMEADIFVPGHGPITDKKGVDSIKAYWHYIEAEARKRYDDGMNAEDAAFDIDLGPYGSWGEKERIVINAAALFKEFKGDDTPLNAVELFGLMARMV
ncbi:MAG: MBL fold metallo-hydrolase [Deltaproteobacteria bacterium]|nr:MBL fold metallo-hydrolase [Deltaproteobacteria bacterium]